MIFSEFQIDTFTSVTLPIVLAIFIATFAATFFITKSIKNDSKDKEPLDKSVSKIKSSSTLIMTILFVVILVIGWRIVTQEINEKNYYSRLDDKHLNIEYVLKSELCRFGGKYDPKTLYACQAKEKAAQEIVLRGLKK